MRPDLSRPINRIAEWLSTPTGFILTFVVLMMGIAIGWMVRFSDLFMLAFNLFLSILAIVISGIILVSAARSEAALQVKLDYLIDASKASNKLIGIEHKDVSEIEVERKVVERLAAMDLDTAIEREVEEEVDEQLKARGSKRPQK